MIETKVDPVKQEEQPQPESAAARSAMNEGRIDANAFEIINRLHAAHDEGFDAALLNPAGFTRGYAALVAAIGMVGFPTWEIHISNPARRGLHSDIATACQGTVTGFGIAGYDIAFRGILAHLKK